MGTRLETPLQCSEVAGEAFLAPWQQREAILLSSTAHCAPPRLWNVGRSSCPIPPHHRRLPATTTLTRARSAAPAAAPLRSPPLQWRAPHKNWRSSESTRTMGGLARCGHRDLRAPHKNWRSANNGRPSALRPSRFARATQELEIIGINQNNGRPSALRPSRFFKSSSSGS